MRGVLVLIASLARGAWGYNAGAAHQPTRISGGDATARPLCVLTLATGSRRLCDGFHQTLIAEVADAHGAMLRVQPLALRTCSNVALARLLVPDSPCIGWLYSDDRCDAIQQLRVRVRLLDPPCSIFVRAGAARAATADEALIMQTLRLAHGGRTQHAEDSYSLLEGFLSI